MSMTATFIQIEPAELARFQADPSQVEMLFVATAMPPAFLALSEAMQKRVRARGPQLLAGTLSALDPAIRKQLEERLGRSASSFAAGAGGDELLKLMQERVARMTRAAESARPKAKLSLDKAWHGVHYLLCGETEPGSALLSQPVLGGAAIGDDDEGFSGYGPARYFTADQVAELSQALGRPGIENEAAARFDAGRMSELQIYPGWRPSDLEWVMEAFRSLRNFYADATAKKRAMVTCLV